MFLPIKKEKQKELRLELPDYSEEYYRFLEKNKAKEDKKETVIHIQIY